MMKLLTIVSLTLLLSCGKVNHKVSGVPQKVEVETPDKIDVDHNIKIDPAQFLDICSSDAKEEGYEENTEEYDAFVKDCQTRKVGEFLDILDKVLNNPDEEETDA